MHVRFSTSLGLPVCEEGSSVSLGYLGSILLDPDTGKVEGFLVRQGGIFGYERFLSCQDILRWTLRVVVSSADVLCDPRDIIRLEPLLVSPRPVLGQKIVTEGGRVIGWCADLQFDTTHFLLEWIFPKRFWRWGVPIPASHILEVKPGGIVIRDLKADLRVKTQTPVTLLPTVTEVEAA